MPIEEIISALARRAARKQLDQKMAALMPYKQFWYDAPKVDKFESEILKEPYQKETHTFRDRAYPKEMVPMEAPGDYGFMTPSVGYIENYTEEARKDNPQFKISPTSIEARKEILDKNYIRFLQMLFPEFNPTQKPNQITSPGTVIKRDFSKPPFSR